MTDHSEWLDTKAPFTVVEPSDPQDWGRFVALWGGGESDTLGLQSIVKVARAAGAKSIVIENGYPDLDQLSEAEYWSRQFALPHTDVYRLHFFSSCVNDRFPMGKQDGYLGYAVVARPVGRLIRAFLTPPPCMACNVRGDLLAEDEPTTCRHCAKTMDAADSVEGRITVASETVELFGSEYRIAGIPYCGQEAWHLQCGHAAAWTCLFTGYLHGMAPRSTLRDVIEAGSSTEVDYQRAVSATGTNLFQLQTIFTKRGLPALVYPVKDVIDDDRLTLDTVRPDNDLSSANRALLGTVCNYLNSGLPVVVTTNKHTITLIGWRRIGAPDGEMELLYNDADAVFCSLPASELRAQDWKYLVIPLPPNVVLSGEAAQAEAYRALKNLTEYLTDFVTDDIASLARQAAHQVITQLDEARLSLRLQLKRRHDYRADIELTETARSHDVAAALSVLRLPEWVWVAEFQDRVARERSEPCVVAEFIFDTTSPDDAPHAASFSLGPVTWCNWPYDQRSMPATTVTASSDQSVPGRQFGWISQVHTGSEGRSLSVSKKNQQLVGKTGGER